MSDEFFKESDFYATATKVGFDRDTNYPRYACEIANRLLKEHCWIHYNNDGKGYRVLPNRDEKDSAEILLKELVDNTRVLGFASGFNMDNFIDRARKLLEETKHSVSTVSFVALGDCQLDWPEKR